MGRLRTRCLRWAWCPTRYSKRKHYTRHAHQMIKHIIWSFAHIEKQLASLTVYLLGWCLSWPPDYSSVSGWSANITSRKIPCEASVCWLTEEKNFLSPQVLPLTLIWPPFTLPLSFPFLFYPNHPDVCVWPGELPGPLYWDHWRVFERVWHGNGQGAIPARRMRTVSSLCTHIPTHTREHP